MDDHASAGSGTGGASGRIDPPAELPESVPGLLKTAAVFDGLLMGYLVLWPGHFWHLIGRVPPAHLGVWQWIGLLVGLLGLGCWLAAADPVRHRLLVQISGAARLLALPVVAWQVGVLGNLPAAMFWPALVWGGVWVLPFGWSLQAIRRVERTRAAWGPVAPIADEPAEAVGTVVAPSHPRSIEAWLAETHTSLGPSLAELSRKQRVLLVFLRHLGCTFCREAVADLVAERPTIEAGGAVIVLVHMGTPAQIEALLAHRGAGRMHHLADPGQHLYRAFDLARGRFGQLLGPAVWWRGVEAGVLRGHGVGRLVGDGFQMPGVFVLHQGRVVTEFRHANAGERPDYAGLCRRWEDPRSSDAEDRSATRA